MPLGCCFVNYVLLNLAAIGCLLGAWQFARKAQTYEMMHDELAEKWGIDPDAGSGGYGMKTPVWVGEFGSSARYPKEVAQGAAFYRPGPSSAGSPLGGVPAPWKECPAKSGFSDPRGWVGKPCACPGGAVRFGRAGWPGKAWSDVRRYGDGTPRGAGARPARDRLARRPASAATTSGGCGAIGSPGKRGAGKRPAGGANPRCGPRRTRRS